MILLFEVGREYDFAENGGTRMSSSGTAVYSFYAGSDLIFPAAEAIIF